MSARQIGRPVKRWLKNAGPLADLLRDQGLKSGAKAWADITRGDGRVRFDRGGPLWIARESEPKWSVNRIVASADLQTLADVVTDADRVVLDAGAHSGLFSSLVKRSHPDARVVAIEANPDLHPVIRSNLKLYSNWDLVEKAISDTTGSAIFFRNPDATQTSALSQESAETFGSGRSDPISVPTTTIDDLADDMGVHGFDVIKLDIQGAEAAAIKGAARTIHRTRALIIEVTFLERRPEDLLLLLREEFGDPVMLQPVMSGADLLFTRR